jgi:large subunit ribosomal protein L7Ae
MNMAMPYVKYSTPKELVEQIYNAVEMVRDTGKLRRGVNEATKAIERGTAKLVVVAEDVTPPEIVAHLPVLSAEKDVTCAFVPSKKELGTACGIDVPTTSLAVVEEGNAKDTIVQISKKINDLKGGKTEAAPAEKPAETPEAPAAEAPEEKTEETKEGE